MTNKPYICTNCKKEIKYSCCSKRYELNLMSTDLIHIIVDKLEIPTNGQISAISSILRFCSKKCLKDFIVKI